MVVRWQLIPLLKLPRNQVKQNKSHPNMNAGMFKCEFGGKRFKE
nr:hypothetical protein P5626_15455 [Bacillus subtilis]WGD74402.1 hypothetical protein P5668_10900 [Bacillus subtilis]WGE03948.1 hypothetical protein P5651_09920 [Bacillus subtilis]